MSALAERTDPFEVIADTRQITREQWLEIRRTGFGGSDAGAIMGVSRWGSPLSVWADKRGLLPERETTDVMEYGKRVEPILRTWAQDAIRGEHPDWIPYVHEWPDMIRSTSYPWAIADLDGMVNVLARDTGGLELKDADRSQASHWRDDELPDDYYWQVQHYMAVTGWPWFYVFATVGKRPVLRFVPRNEAGIVQLMETERGLWELVQSGDMPAPSGLECDDRVLSELYQGGGEMVDLGHDGEDLMLCYLEAKAEIKEKQEIADKLKQSIKAAMGNATKGISPGFYANWSRFPMKRLDGDGAEEGPTGDCGKVHEGNPGRAIRRRRQGQESKGGIEAWQSCMCGSVVIATTPVLAM